MSDPFQRLHDSAFRRLGADAVYTPPSGSPVPCRVLLGQGDAEWRDHGPGVTTPARIAELRVSEVPVVKEKGLLAIGGQTFTVQRASQPDDDRLLWRAELR